MNGSAKRSVSICWSVASDTRPQPAETTLRLRAMDLLRERKTVNVSVVGSPIGTPVNRGVGDVLTEEEGKTWATAVELGSKPGSGAVWACLPSVRRADQRTSAGFRAVPGMRPGTSISEVSEV